jgi:hypothetical protein
MPQAERLRRHPRRIHSGAGVCRKPRAEPEASASPMTPDVELVNQGPVTLLLDSRKAF